MTPLAAKTVDRASGALLLLLGIGAIWHAQSLSVPFASDPIGPKAFPTIAGAVLALAGASIMLRPEAIDVEAGHRMRVASVAIASLVYDALRRRAGDELADLLFVTLCMANERGLDLERGFTRMMDKIETRDADRWTKKDAPPRP